MTTDSTLLQNTTYM